ncbi:S-adenosylmethionine decarboxylase family protein [Roseimaritima ulvae]|uniref:S-adenosylmethionine decarboxylase proenzyme n=1 Tax=Roseimaritima ulvae TaxID=980254 RepID=A0A5B9R054_9BACT|nr:S-adenosylmethionine decarboxylase [Roseimaritima ulvae]QEG39653.1 S-adenosylmethionine decarboxylase proenzyme precursor [Roseimaritima ulvae]
MTQPIPSAISPSEVVVPPTGIEWIIDAHGCDQNRLREADRLVALCRDVIGDLGLNVVGQPQVHVFPAPGGVTAVYLLSESHLTLHTYPEYGTATFNLYCCRTRPDWPWRQELTRRLDAFQVSIRSLQRGLAPGSSVAEPLATKRGQR